MTEVQAKVYIGSKVAAVRHETSTLSKSLRVAWAALIEAAERAEQNLRESKML